MPAELDQLCRDLDTDKLRAQFPSNFIFFCGGPTSRTPTDPLSMRQFLLNDRKIGLQLHSRVVVAEEATQLYRDSRYPDLISFEEDLARIAAMVLVIAESPGAFAELRAFASIETIRKSLVVIAQQDHATSESFIRFGPIQRIINDDQDRVAFFPWRTNRKNRLVKQSALPHVAEIVDYINELLSRRPTVQKLIPGDAAYPFVILYWLIFLAFAIPITKLRYLAKLMLGPLGEDEVTQKLYCMKLAGWIDSFSYSSITYYCCRSDCDPLHYAFRGGVVERDSIRRRFEASTAIQREVDLRQNVRKEAARRRRLVGR